MTKLAYLLHDDLANNNNNNNIITKLNDVPMQGLSPQPACLCVCLLYLLPGQLKRFEIDLLPLGWSVIMIRGDGSP